MSSGNLSPLTIREVNEVGTETATYICSSTPSVGEKKPTRRIDIVQPGAVHSIGDADDKSSSSSPSLLSFQGLKFQVTILVQSLLSVFLPSGFPHTVTPDYVPYQIYDSLQAFSSSIAGLLASRAVLEGLGVGDSKTGDESPKSSSATAVVLLSILQESMGRIATILFAWRLGTALEPEAKRWRLAADVFNDLGMILDCLSPAIPTTAFWGWYLRIGVLSSASVLRSLCGVAAGSSKATLSQHFAIEEKGGNVGELNAKDSSQETVISLAGMWAGSLVLSMTISRTATWITLIFLLIIHITMNYLAVRSVCMTSLNRQRANIVFSTLWKEDRALTPVEAAKLERIFESDGVLRWSNSGVIGHCQIGVSFNKLLQFIGGVKHQKTNSILASDVIFQHLTQTFSQEKYILWYDHNTKQAMIVLKSGVTFEDQLKAWGHALNLAKATQEVQLKRTNQHQVAIEETVTLTRETLKDWNQLFPKAMKQLEQIGWDLKTPSLETKPGIRIVVE